MRCWHASLALREAGTSERQVKHSTNFSGGGGFRGGDGGWGGGDLNIELNMLEGRSGLRRKGEGGSCFGGWGNGVVETID